MMWLGWLVIAMMAEVPDGATLTGDSAAHVSQDVVYLSDVILGISKYQLDYTKMLGLDATSYPLWPKATPGDPLSIAGQSYSKGIGASPGDIVVVLDGEYEAFAAEVGVQTGDEGTAVFAVTVDGERRFESGEMKSGDAAKKMHISLVGASQMTLTTASGVRADWADARLFRATGTAPAAAPDMAPFARVVTWDPARKDGVRVNRLTEFPAAGRVSRVRDRCPGRRQLCRAGRSQRRRLHRPGVARGKAVGPREYRIRRNDMSVVGRCVR